MGVTLERVQNKFACIIGELCSEPDILSEFAIWLDLRLAEYKAKGAIQLECSGEMPDPSWLRGHKKPPKRIKTQHYDPTPQYIEDIPHELSERLSVSPEIVVVKEERSDSTDIFPVDVYRHENSSSNINNSRKRLSTDGSSVGHLDKMPRLSLSTSVLEPVNQSLMSIISESTADDIDTAANLSADFSNIDSSNIDNSLYIPSSSYSLPSTSRDETTNQQDGSNSDLSCSGFGLSTIDSAEEISQLAQTKWPDGDSDKHNYPDSLSIVNVKARVVDYHLKPPQTLTSISSSVRFFEKWLFLKVGRHIKVEDTDPAELDRYLFEFFPRLKRSDGRFYDGTYITKCRCYIERFLREKGYPYSITHSPQFLQSQQAFYIWKKELSSINVNK